MNRRIDLGNAITAGVLVGLLAVAVVFSPLAKVPRPTRTQLLDSALKVSFAMPASSHVNKGVLSLMLPHTPAQPLSDDSTYALAERVAKFAHAQYRDTTIEAVTVLFMQPNGYFGGGFLPLLLDGRATPVSVSVAPSMDDEATIRTLPLTTGYAARFPMQWADRSREVVWESIYVVGADSTCRCWRVNTAGLRRGFRQLEIPLKP